MLEQLCHQFHVQLKPVQNGLFSVVGEWEHVDKLSDEILKMLVLESTTAAFSAAFSDNMSSATSANTHGRPGSDLLLSASQVASSNEMDVDHANKATLEAFQINRITYDLTSLVAREHLSAIEKDCKVQFTCTPAQNAAVLVTVIGTDKGSDVARGRSLLHNLYCQVSNKMGETCIETSTTTDVSPLTSYPWAKNGIILHSESDRKFTLIGLKDKLQSAEIEARRLLKVGERKEDKTAKGMFN